MDELVLAERKRLADLEQVVERGLQTFYEVGSALLEIRDKRLYRQSHNTFETYCRERFGFSDSRGRQLIAAARTVTAVTQLGLPAPTTEREARELARQLRSHADELDGGNDDRRKLIESAAGLLKQADENMRLAIREAQLAIGVDPADPEVVAEAERIVKHAYAWLDEPTPDRLRH